MKPFIKAKRIWSGRCNEPNQYALFKDCFELTDIVQDVILKIRADNRYSLTVNGVWIAAQQY